ncbi:Uncharacterized protein pbN1_13770 [Aromatoleum bremense]|nr:Uncharacterized protein pbN1_13770 [Aromatoleum bremense]
MDRVEGRSTLKSPLSHYRNDCPEPLGLSRRGRAGDPEHQRISGDYRLGFLPFD